MSLDQSQAVLEADGLRRKQNFKKLLDAGQKIGSCAETADIVSTLQRVRVLVNASGKLCGEGKVTDRVYNSSEIVLDAQVIKLSHELVGMALSKKGATNFSDTEFALAITNLLFRDGQRANWDLVAEECAKIQLSSHYSVNMLGTFDPTERAVEKSQKEKLKKQRKELEMEKRPDKLRKIEGEGMEAQKLNIIMTKIGAEYRRTKKSLPYYNVVIDPEDFMYTVDNVFQIAFLVKDGYIEIIEGDDGMPAINPIGKDQREANLSKKKKHTISTIRPAFCRDMAKKYKIKHAFLDFERSSSGTQ